MNVAPVIAFRLLASTWNPEAVAAIQRHYTGSAGPPPGKKLTWEVLEGGVRVGWISLGEPAYKLAPRRRLGLKDARPLERTVCCSLFRLEGEGRISSASTILRLWHPAAAADWEARYGWAPVHWETLVGSEGPGREVHSGPLGACFRRAGYRSLGMTTGRSARRPPGSTHGPRVWSDSTPKLVLYRGPLPRVAPETGDLNPCGNP